eukprot:Skav225321  [mRNA]  locus=scaffold891:179835:180197:+ [translate_table: standard]
MPLLIASLPRQGNQSCPSRWMVTPTAEARRSSRWQSFSVAGAPARYSHEFGAELLRDKQNVSKVPNRKSRGKLRQKGHGTCGLFDDQVRQPIEEHTSALLSTAYLHNAKNAHRMHRMYTA